MGFWRKFGPLLAGIAGGIIGGFLGPGAFSWTGFSIGSTFGGYLLNRPKKADLTGAQVQKSAYGEMIPVVYGRSPESLAGNIIDCPENGGLEEVPWQQGIKRSFTGAVLFSEGENGDGCGERLIEKLWGNDILVFDRTAPTNKQKIYFWQNAESYNPGNPGLVFQSLATDTPGGEMTFTYDAATGTEHFSGMQDAKGFWGKSNEFYLYRGTRKQQPCPVLAALHGGKVPAYRNCVYVVFNRLLLKPWDEGLPTFKAQIYNPTTGVRQIVTAHLVRGGCDPERMDLSALDTCTITTVDGCLQLEREPARELADSLCAWVFADLVEVDGKIKASNRANPLTFTLNRDDLSAYGNDDEGNENGETPPAIKQSLNSTTSAPNILRVSFYDKGLRGNVNSLPAPRQVGTGNNEQEIRLPILTDATTAQKWAQMALDEMWAGGTPAEISLALAHIKKAPGDVLRIPDKEGNLSEWRIVDQTLGTPGVITCSCQSYNAECYNQPHGPASVFWPPGSVTSHDPPDTALIDTVAQDDEDVNANGLTLYWAASAGKDEAWNSSELAFGSKTNILAVLDGPRAILGITNTDLPIGSTKIYDEGAAVRVTLTDSRQTLESVTIQEARNGANTALINGHRVSFLNATFISAGVYDLSVMLFGGRGTETFEMPSGSRFLLLRDAYNQPTPGWRKVVLRGLDYVKVHRAPTGTKWFLHHGQSEQVGMFTQTLQLNAEKAISPVYVRLASDGAGGAILRFHARSRGDNADLYWQAGGTPNLTDPLSFDVVLYEPGTSDVLHTRRVSTLSAGKSAQMETLYTAAQLSAIYDGAPELLEGMVYPINKVGRGFGRPFTLLMP